MKKQILKSALIALAGVVVISGSSWATPVEAGSETPLSTVLTNAGYTIDVNNDQEAYDSYWQISEGASSGSWATLLIEIAGNAATNIFGIFDSAGHTLALLNGSADDGDKVSISFGSNGKLSAAFWDYDTDGNLVSINTIASNINFSSVFGFYLSTVNGIFYSDSTKNTGGSDQMVAYEGTGSNGLTANHYILAWEDVVYGSSDKDFNDMVLLVESVNPVPEPATMMMFGLGIAGLAGIARRKQNN